MVSRSRCGGFALVSADAEATASMSAAAIVSFMDCLSLCMDSLISRTSVSSFSMRSFWVVITLIPIDRLQTRGYMKWGMKVVME